MFAIHSLAALVQSTGDDGLSLAEIVDALPTDPVSLFAIILLLGCAGLVLWYGKRTSGGGRPSA